MIDTIENKLYFQSILHEKTANVLTQHVYITSDEKAEDEDWLLIIDDFETYVHKHKGDNLPTTSWKKIILTTDQDLIAEGIQPIDDTFLQWFVNNSSCEFVDVRYDVLRPFQSVDKGYTIHLPDNEVLGEPKQETFEEIEKNIDREEWINFFKNNSKEEILEYLINYKFPL